MIMWDWERTKEVWKIPLGFELALGIQRGENSPQSWEIVSYVWRSCFGASCKLQKMRHWIKKIGNTLWEGNRIIGKVLRSKVNTSVHMHSKGKQSGEREGLRIQEEKTNYMQQFNNRKKKKKKSRQCFPSTLLMGLKAAKLTSYGNHISRSMIVIALSLFLQRC